MTAHERDALQAFLRQVQQDRPAVQDPVAASMIASALASQPDALYRLVQRAMAAELALKQLPAEALAPGLRPPSAGPRGGESSFLGTAAGVATGVIAGGFLLEGLKSVMQDIGLEDTPGQGLDAVGDVADWV